MILITVYCVIGTAKNSSFFLKNKKLNHLYSDGTCAILGREDDGAFVQLQQQEVSLGAGLVHGHQHALLAARADVHLHVQLTAHLGEVGQTEKIRQTIFGYIKRENKAGDIWLI